MNLVAEGQAGEGYGVGTIQCFDCRDKRWDREHVLENFTHARLRTTLATDFTHAQMRTTRSTNESSEQRCQINSSIARLQYCILALPNVTIWKKETKLIPMGLSVSFATWYTITEMKFSIKVNHTLLN